MLEMLTNPEIENRFVQSTKHWCRVLEYCMLCRFPLKDMMIRWRHVCNKCSDSMTEEESDKLWHVALAKYKYGEQI